MYVAQTCPKWHQMSNLDRLSLKRFKFPPLPSFPKREETFLITHKNHKKYYNMWRYYIDIIPSHSKSIAVVQYTHPV